VSNKIQQNPTKSNLNLKNASNRFCKKDLHQIFDDQALQESSAQLESVKIRCKHLPSLSVYPVVGEVFFLSSGENAFPISMRYINEDNMHIQADYLPQTWKEQMISISQALASFLGAVGVPQGKAEYWALGSSSGYLAQIACNQEIHSESSNYSSAAVILMDRVG
jgi:hypothetical protein